MIEHPRTGEQVEFLSETPDLLVMHTRWTRPGHRVVEHVHPGMEERFEVLEGRAAFRIGGVESEAGPGEVVVAPTGTRHLAGNPTDVPVRVRIEMRPACARRGAAGGRGRPRRERQRLGQRGHGPLRRA
ncbi:MAG TPA: cupin domain-containing protein [Acidimicrobiales bacterium]|nr:cupin domain-containing protein [Acidimicrobiales bacterium]